MMSRGLALPGLSSWLIWWPCLVQHQQVAVLYILDLFQVLSKYLPPGFCKSFGLQRASQCLPIGFLLIFCPSVSFLKQCALPCFASPEASESDPLVDRDHVIIGQS